MVTTVLGRQGPANAIRSVPGSNARRMSITGARFAHISRSRVIPGASRRLGGLAHWRADPAPRQLPRLAASSQLSQAELEELIAENAKLRVLLNTYADRLSPEQVAGLTKQYEEIAALAEASGLRLEPLPLAEEPAAADAAQAVEFNDGKVKAWVVEKDDVVSFSFNDNPPARVKAAAASASAAAGSGGSRAAAASWARPADVPAAAAAANGTVSAAANGAATPAAPAANGAAATPAPVAAAAAAPAPAADPSSALAAAMAAAAGAAGEPVAAAAAPVAAEPAVPAEPEVTPVEALVNMEAAPIAAEELVAATAVAAEVVAAAPAAETAPPAPAALPSLPPAMAPPALPPLPPAAVPGVSPIKSSAAARASAAQRMAALAAAQAQAAAAAPAIASPPPPAAVGMPPAPVQDFTGPAPTAPLFGGEQQPPAGPIAQAWAEPQQMQQAGAAMVVPALPQEDDILDIPDPIEAAKVQIVLPKLSPEEIARREAAKKAERDLARKLVDTHDPVALAARRHGWLMFTVPEKPVAGCDVVIYYNRTQSEVLRDRNRIQAVLGYNHWELAGEATRVDLTPSAIPHIDNSDFWMCRFRIPEESYELNFVLTDGESLFDNNNGQDFTYATSAGSSWEEWTAAAQQRAEQLEQERYEQEEARRKEEGQGAYVDKEKLDREAAARRVAELRDGYLAMREGGVSKRKVSDDPASKTLWSVAPSPLVAGRKGTLLYNSRAGPFGWIADRRSNKRSAKVVEGQHVPILHYGFNNWAFKSAPTPMRHSMVGDEEDELWWELEFDIPATAACVNFVINCEATWDNNGGKDHKILVALPPPYTAETVGEWAELMFDKFLEQEKEARLSAEAIAAAKEEKRMLLRGAAKEKAREVVRRQMKHVMFTEPAVIRAGERVTVYYCPEDTPLAGSSQVYFTGGFNRWSHKRALGPVAMRPPGENGKHWQVRFTVPKDALQLDFVFSNVLGGDGIYDNRGGFDYHLPIEGGIGTMPGKLHVCHIAVEMAPIAKVGGLGDVVTSLARAVQEEGHLVEVILPRYDFFTQSPLLAGNMRYETEFEWGGTRIYVSTATVEGLRCFFIEPKNGFFATPTVYGRYDDEVRFDFFCKAALEFLLKTARAPDILHCHDWSTAHVARSFWEDYQPYGLQKPKVVFTIHNMNYGEKKLAEGASYCQKFTTVSPTYAFEVGSHPAIADNAHKFMGIRNGIDTDIWSPSENVFMPLAYDADSMEEGKRRAREELRKRVNITGWQDKAIVAVVSRLTPQKGVHLIKHAAYKSIERGCQFVLLGTAPDPKVALEFDTLSHELGHGQDAGFVFSYDEPLSHLIYAAADIILVPSMFEPCGLTQMIAMRYGAVPVVRHTGGLRDTVFDVDNDKARAAWEVAGSSDFMRDRVDETNGFAFEGMDEDGLDYALNRAIDAYYNDRRWFRSLQARIMRQDWSWNRPALDYVELYYSVIRS